MIYDGVPGPGIPARFVGRAIPRRCEECGVPFDAVVRNQVVCPRKECKVQRERRRVKEFRERKKKGRGK
jgi:hypothetical protein